MPVPTTSGALLPLSVGEKGVNWRRVIVRGTPGHAYGFGLHSPRIPNTEYQTMFHGNNERVDVDSLRLSALMWEALCRDFLG